MSSCAKREPESPYKKTKPVTPGADATVLYMSFAYINPAQIPDINCCIQYT